MSEDGFVAHPVTEGATAARERRGSRHEHGARWKELRSVAGAGEDLEQGAGHRRTSHGFYGSDHGYLPMLRGHRPAVQSRPSPRTKQELETDLLLLSYRPDGAVKVYRYSPDGRYFASATSTRFVLAFELTSTLS